MSSPEGAGDKSRGVLKVGPAKFDQFIQQVQALLVTEDETLFARGDLLVAQHLDAEGMRTAAEL